MKQSKQAARSIEDQPINSDRRSGAMRAAAADRRAFEASDVEVDVGIAMVDALDDILKWERASERSMKAAAKVEPTDS